MIDLIEYKGKFYPKFQAEGNAAQYAIPFAMKVCRGVGYDIGFGKWEWKFPTAIGIDPALTPYSATNLPTEKYGLVDYIFSSHCLEHIENWYSVLEYWHRELKPNGVLFLYLPDYSQEYWRPWNNRKHLSVFTPEIMKDVFDSFHMNNVFCSGVDLNNSFMVMGQRGNVQ